MIMRIFAVSLLLLSLGVPRGSASPPPGSEPVVLEGTTIFEATSSSRSIAVRFPGRIPFPDGLEVSFDGNGRVFGYILQKIGDYDDDDRPTIEDLTLGYCTTEGCRARRVPHIGSVRSVGSYISGKWRLYVIADGAPVSVVMKLEGQVGELRVTPKDAVRATIRTLQPEVTESSGQSVFAAGTFSKSHQDSYGLVGLWVRSDLHTATFAGDCSYEQAPPVREQAFLPGCPGGKGIIYPRIGPVGRDEVALVAAHACCVEGLGAWYATPAQVFDSGAIAAWFELSDSM